MKIVNDTDLSYKEIGILIDLIIENNLGDTIYYGKEDEFTLKNIFLDEKLKVQIRYLKKYVEWRFSYGK
jgi:hypothetical protein